MKLFLDTAEVKDIEDRVQTGLISGVTGYNKLKQEIEVAKQLPVYEVQETADGALLKQKVHYLEKEIEKLEDKVNNLENKVYKR